MPIDTDRLVHIANALKSLEQHHQKLLAELHRIAGGGAPALKPAPVARRRGRPPRSPASPAVVPTRAELVVSRRKSRGLTTSILGVMQENGAAYTAGDLVRELKLPKTKLATVNATLTRLVKDGRLRKDEERGYVAT